MNKFLCSVCLVVTMSARADSLRFTSGTIKPDLTNVVLSLAGPNNLVIQVQRLNKTNDTWESQGNLSLSASGTGSFTNSLVEGIYGFYRAKATNDSYYSTNAYGAVVGFLTSGGYSMIGNIFGRLDLTNIIRTPVDGTQVSKYYSSSNSYVVATYDDMDGTWSKPLSFDIAEGFFVKSPTNSAMRYVIDGLFDTNAITRTLYPNLNLIATPLYHVSPTNTWTVDTLTTSQPGGASSLPVQQPGYDPQCILLQLWDASGAYQTNKLNSAGQWTSAGTNVAPQIKITEGFWLQRQTNTNTTWTVSRPIW